MGETWYKVHKYFYRGTNFIEKVEADKSTDKSILISGNRLEIRSSFTNYFKTFDEAKQFALDRAQKRIHSARQKLDESYREYDAIINQKKCD